MAISSKASARGGSGLVSNNPKPAPKPSNSTKNVGHNAAESATQGFGMGERAASKKPVKIAAPTASMSIAYAKGKSGSVNKSKSGSTFKSAGKSGSIKKKPATDNHAKPKVGPTTSKTKSTAGTFGMAGASASAGRSQSISNTKPVAQSKKNTGK